MGVEEVLKFVEEVLKFVVEKLKEALAAVENLGGEAFGWLDDVFPPETRVDTINHWFHVAVPWIVGAVKLMVVIWFLRCCWRCCCCDGGGGGRVRMMKAPGRNCRMPRNVFESNPQGYFRNLRSHQGEKLC